MVARTNSEMRHTRQSNPLALHAGVPRRLATPGRADAESLTGGSKVALEWAAA